MKFIISPVHSNLNINLIVNVRWIAKLRWKFHGIWNNLSRYFTVNILPSAFQSQHFFEKRISNGVKSYEKGVHVENLNCCSSIMREKGSAHLSSLYSFLVCLSY